MNKNIIHKDNDFEVEIDQSKIDYTLWGNHLEIIINTIIPNWFIKWWKIS